MLGIFSRILALVVLSVGVPASAFQSSIEERRAAMGQVFDHGRTNGVEGATIVPAVCAPIWTIAGAMAIRNPDELLDTSPLLTERDTSAMWRHWWLVHQESAQSPQSPIPGYQQALGQLRAMLTSGNPHFFRLLGACWVEPVERKIDDGEMLLRNFLVQQGALPSEFAVSASDRTLRKTAIAYEIIKSDPDDTQRFFHNKQSSGDPKRDLETATTSLIAQRVEAKGIPASAVSAIARISIDPVLDFETVRTVYTMDCEVF